MILSIPLSYRLPPDRLIWSQTPTGVFTTRSAYHLLVNDASINTARPSRSKPNPQKKFWRGLWKLQVPNKVKHFAWRACKHALPTMDNLHHRHVVSSALCFICKSQVEDSLYALWGCTELEVVFGAAFPGSVTLLPLPQPISLTYLFRFLKVIVDNRDEFFICLAWFLWKRRNSVRLDHSLQPLNMVYSQAGKLLTDFSNAQDTLLEPIRTASSTSWLPPDLQLYEANFDGVVFRSSNSAGLGVIIGDRQGETIGGLSMRVPLPFSVTEVEALACGQAKKFAAEIGLHDVQFEGDCLTVIKALTEGSATQAVFGNLIEDTPCASLSIFLFWFVMLVVIVIR